MAIHYDTPTRRAFEMAFDMLGETSKRALIYWLERDYKISLATGKNVTEEKMFNALQDLLGKNGAELMTNIARKYVITMG